MSLENYKNLTTSEIIVAIIGAAIGQTLRAMWFIYLAKVIWK